MPRTLPRRTEHQAPPGRRRSRAADERDRSPRARMVTTRNCCHCWTRSGCPATGPGRPRNRPEAVLADKAYSHPSTRAALRARRVRFTSPERADQIARRQGHGARGGRPPAVDFDEYKQAQRRRAMLQPAQAIPRLRHPLRQTRRLLPRRDPHHRHRLLAPMTYRTGPSHPRPAAQRSVAARGHGARPGGAHAARDRHRRGARGGLWTERPDWRGCWSTWMLQW